ncbi:MAG: phosphoadenosine phosphosulfate reductase family protein [Candidatus Methanomethylicia archaeon]
MSNNIWRERAEIYWCRSCNVPLITPKCEICNGIGKNITAAPPLDARPAFQEDRKRIVETIRMQYGEEAIKILIPEDKMILLNKITHIDQAEEIIFDGRVIGQIYFDPRIDKWIYKPVEEGAARLILEEAGYWCIINKGRVKKWDRIGRGEIIRGEIPNEGIVAIGNPNGKSIGVGEYNGKEIKVIKAWEPHSPHIINEKSDMGKTIKANENAIKRLERKSSAFIIETERKYGKPICISFSGGKDSLATLLISINSGIKGKMLFNDTGIELPETINYVEEISNKLNIELIKAEAGKIFWEALDVFGPPARDYRWCCKTCKLIPIMKTMKKEYPKGSLTIVGQRRYESFSRSKSPSIWKNRWLPDSINASPIMNWSALHIWLYIIWGKMDANPLYQMGFDRLGCWLCPSCEMAEFKLVEKIHPEIWGEWKNRLIHWAKVRGYDEKWVEMGFWRWIKLPGDQRRIAERINIIEYMKIEKRLPTKIIKISGHSPCQGKYSIEAKIDTKISIDNVKDVLPSISDMINVSKKLNTITLSTKRANSVINSNGQITVIAKNEEEAEEELNMILKAILRGMHCVKCGSCQNICPTKSIRIEDHPIINLKTCIKCGKCQINCPVTEYIGKIIMWRISENDG